MLALFYKGGIVMWPLLVCSILSLAVTLDRLAVFSRSGQSLNRVAATMKATALTHSHQVRDHLDMIAQEEIDRLKKGLDILDAVITMAPLLGILGTVTGIIHSFDLLGQAGIQTPRDVAVGISQALITTAAGLSIALLTVVPYNIFINRINKRTRLLNKIILQIESSVQKQKREAYDTERI